MTTQEFNWHDYNESQMKEKILFMRLLRELCDLIGQATTSKGQKASRSLRHALCPCSNMPGIQEAA